MRGRRPATAVVLAATTIVAAAMFLAHPTIGTARAGSACDSYQTLFTGTLPTQTLTNSNILNWPAGIQSQAGEYIDVVVDFGDGFSQRVYADHTTSAFASHAYPATGSYTVTVRGRGVNFVPGPCEYPFDQTWTVIVQSVPTSGPTITIATPSPGPSPSPTSAAIVEPRDNNSGGGVSDITAGENRPNMVRSVPGPDDISLDASVIATNIGFVGFTLIAIFVSAQIFNSTIAENRAEIERSLDRVIGPLRDAWKSTTTAAGPAARSQVVQTFGWPALVLALTVAVYGFTDPDFPTARSSAVVALSVLICVGAVTYITEGGGAQFMRSRYGQRVAIQPFPFAIAIAAMNVAFARVIDFGPGVIFGFVATTVFLRPSTLTANQQGQATVVPLSLLLGLSLAAWALVVPFRRWSEDAGATIPAFYEGAAVTIFSGGIQSLFFSMIPVSFMAGEKVLRWSLPAWVALAAVLAFLFWHALLNQDESFFDAMTSTVSLAAICVLIGAVALTAVTWLYFRLRRPGLQPA